MSDRADLARLLEDLPTLEAERDQDLASEVIDLLHCLGFVYLRHGQATRAVVLLMLASRAAPDRADVLRTLAAAMIGAGLGAQAMVIVDRICAIEPEGAGHPMIALMRARALLLQQRGEEARIVFRDQVAPAAGSHALTIA